jgi:heme exporter protein C
MKRAFPIFAVLTALLLSYALYEALVAAPTEKTMGDVQRIFYYHVPSAWTAFLLFLINFVASVVYLIRRSHTADIVAVVTAEVGVVFCTVVLVTGPLWARPVWGIWWTWDVRLTSTLVLWLIYVSYLMLRRSMSRSSISPSGFSAANIPSPSLEVEARLIRACYISCCSIGLRSSVSLR